MQFHQGTRLDKAHCNSRHYKCPSSGRTRCDSRDVEVVQHQEIMQEYVKSTDTSACNLELDVICA